MRFLNGHIGILNILIIRIHQNSLKISDDSDEDTVERALATRSHH